MPIRVVRFEPTPNPNALKCWVDRRVSDGPRSFLNAEAAAHAALGGDPLPAALFAVAGVTNVLLLGDWLTVGKSAQADWKTVRKGVERALRAQP